jgi:SAM-dependent methyltransferase
MKQGLIPYLACPDCGGEIRVTKTVSLGGLEIFDGALACVGCAKEFPIVGGVPRFADLESVEPEKAATASSFGFEWKHFTQEDERYGDQFLGWITPVTPEFFKDKVVLDGGCGKGRHMLLAASWGARAVVGVDLSHAGESAFAATRGAENMHVVQADVCHLPFKQSFDYAYSIGVLDHLPDPFTGFKSLASKVKPGGHVSVWVYGAENNGWIINLVNPVRERFTSRIHPRALLHLSTIPTAAVYTVSKLLRPLSKLPAGGEVVNRLFYSEYLTYISHFGWREQHTIVFDHLVAPVAHYIRRGEILKWWREICADETVICLLNRNSWRGFGKMNGNK